MSAPKNSDPSKFYLSPSRIDTYNECSQRYAAKYVWKMPDTGNDGSSRGSTCHDVLELLLKPKHHALYSAAIHADTCTEVPALWRFILRKARKYRVDDPANLELIDGFMLVALKNEFYGPKPIWITHPDKVADPKAYGTIKAEGEREFNIEVPMPDGRVWRARGKIDKTFTIRDEHGLALTCDDYKSSKLKFDGEKETFNTQSIIYHLALKILHPDISRRRFRFLFLKFPKKPWQEVESMSEEQLDGYQWVLADLHEAMEKFTLTNASDNLAALSEDYRWLCGREGTKKDGNPNWICPVRRPRDYWVALDAKDKIITSADLEADLKANELTKKLAGKTTVRVEKRFYPGCPAYFNDKGRARNFN